MGPYPAVMATRLPLDQRLNGKAKRPQELLGWSDNKTNIYYDDRYLHYFYLPRAHYEYTPIDLQTGFDPKTYDPDRNVTNQIDSLLTPIMHYEKQNGEKISARVICWRGTLTKLLKRSQVRVDRFVADEDLAFDVVGYDGQIFISDPPKVKEKFDVQQLMFMYSGFEFEHVATLPKPWGECTRDEITSRYNSSSDMKPESYAILVKSGIGSVDCVYGAEVDCLKSAKDEKNKLKEYVELKTSAAIHDPRGMMKMERKLMTTWIQSFLSGVPNVIYGFRDEKMRLVSVEEYSTASIPSMVKNSKYLRPDQRWNGNDIMGFYNVLMKWISNRVEDGKSYRLTCKAHSNEMLLEPADLNYGRKVAFLIDEFVDWRESLK